MIDLSDVVFKRSTDTPNLCDALKLSDYSDEQIWAEASHRTNRVATFTQEEYLDYYPHIRTAIAEIKRRMVEIMPGLNWSETKWTDPECGTTYYDLIGHKWFSQDAQQRFDPDRYDEALGKQEWDAERAAMEQFYQNHLDVHELVDHDLPGELHFSIESSMMHRHG